jgi:peptide/nickel transport system permease protein
MTTVDLTFRRSAGAGTGSAPRSRRGRAVLARAGRWLSVLVPVVLLSTFVTFALGSLSNTNPAASMLGDNATPADISKLNHHLGFDQPLVVQYWHWLSGALRGDLGVSYFTGIPVSQSIVQRLPVDLSIAFVAILLAVVVGGAAGVLAGLRQGSWLDRSITAVCSIASTLPPFVIGIGLVILFATTIHLFPSGGYVGLGSDPGAWLSHIVLPSIALSFEPGVNVTRQLRTALVEVMGQNYITGAVVRGLGSRRVLLRHALRNAAGPALSVIAIYVPTLIGGAVVAESVFSLPGLGQLVLESASSHDVPVVQGALLLTSSLVLFVNLVVTGALGWLRPAAGGR